MDDFFCPAFSQWEPISKMTKKNAKVIGSNPGERMEKDIQNRMAHNDNIRKLCQSFSGSFFLNSLQFKGFDYAKISLCF